MPDTPDSGDPKVKELLDSATRADLERWFGLPSFEQLAEQPAPAEDPESAALHKRRATAMAAVDPALLDALYRRFDPDPPLIRPLPPLALAVAREIAQVDLNRIEHTTIAEPREVQRPDHIEDDLKERTPQALLRDLHRPELNFDKIFEFSDPLAEQRVDIPARIAEALISTRLPMIERSFTQAYALMQELRAERRQPWAELRTPLRQVTE